MSNDLKVIDMACYGRPVTFPVIALSYKVSIARLEDGALVWCISRELEKSDDCRYATVISDTDIRQYPVSPDPSMSPECRQMIKELRALNRPLPPCCNDYSFLESILEDLRNEND